MGSLRGFFSESFGWRFSRSVRFNRRLPIESERPFTAFNSLVEIRVDGVSDQVCGAAFSECEGLEMSIEPKTIREGGRTTGQCT